jgi:hypothetical protein
VSLDSEQLVAVRGFLRTSRLFYTSVPLLRDRPFEFPDAPGDRGALEDAAATKPREGLPRALFLTGSLVTLCGGVWEYVLWRQELIAKSKQPPPVFTLQDLGEYFVHLLSASPDTIAEKLFHTMPILCTAFGILLLLAAIVFALVKVPAHQTDPLLARLLQGTLRAKSAPSNSYVQSLLANPRFKKVFQRAVFTVFPVEISIFDAIDQMLQGDPIERDPLTITPDWDDFVTRLLDTLSNHEPFVHFIENHPGTPPERLYGNGLKEHLEYGMRQLLFTEMLADPDCVFLYRNTSDHWHKIFHWITTADLKKVADFFPKTEKSSGGIDKKSLAVYLLILLLLLSLLAKLPWQTSSGEAKQPPQGPPVAVAVKLDMHEFNEKLEELAAMLCQKCVPQQQTPPPPISITIPPSPAPIINSPPGNTPSINIPSKLEVAVSSTVPAAAPTEIHQNVNLPATPSKDSDPTGDHQHEPTPTMQGDTLVSFTRPNPEQQPTQPKPPKADVSSSFVLHSPSGKDCHYIATLPRTKDVWPPDPVQMNVLPDSKLKLEPDCPQVPTSGTTISVSRQPLYNDLLKAYVSLDEEHSHHLHFFGREQIVVLIHYATPKFE